MPHPFFPLGSTALTPPEAPPTPPFWGPLSADALNWNGVRANRMPRFEHVYPQEAGASQQFAKVAGPHSGS